MRTDPTAFFGGTFALSVLPDSTPLTYRRSWFAGASYTPVTCAHELSCAVEDDHTRSAAPCAVSGLAMANTQRPPLSGRYHRSNPANVVPSWLTIACAPSALVILAHADTVKLLSV